MPGGLGGGKGGKLALHGAWEGMVVNGGYEVLELRLRQSAWGGLGSSDRFVQLFNASSGASKSSTGSGNYTSLSSVNVFDGFLAHILYHLLATCSGPEIKL